jgi:hypothetical protein
MTAAHFVDPSCWSVARPIKEDIEQSAQGGLARRRARVSRPKDKLAPRLFVRQMPLFLENAQKSADGSARRRIRQLPQHLAGRRLPVGIDDIHDLSLAPAQLLRLGHRLLSWLKSERLKY